MMHAAPPVLPPTPARLPFFIWREIDDQLSRSLVMGIGEHRGHGSSR
jgi:hypothetical protein